MRDNVQQPYPRRRGTQYGFTLIELMITVAIIAILSAIAYPSYRQYAIRSERGAAKAALEQAAQAMERQYSVNNAYPATMATNYSTAKYTVAIAAQTTNTFTLSATVISPWADPYCGVLSITHTGVKNAVGGSDNAVNCWRR